MALEPPVFRTGSRLANRARVSDDPQDVPRPYARPKIGRRASDRKALDDWYAQWRHQRHPEQPVRPAEDDTAGSSEA